MLHTFSERWDGLPLHTHIHGRDWAKKRGLNCQSIKGRGGKGLIKIYHSCPATEGLENDSGEIGVKNAKFACKSRIRHAKKGDLSWRFFLLSPRRECFTMPLQPAAVFCVWRIRFSPEESIPLACSSYVRYQGTTFLGGGGKER